MKRYREYIITLLAVPAIFLVGLSSCKKEDIPNLDFKQEMRDFVIGMDNYAESIRPGFLILPQNGIELITDYGEADGPLNAPYMDAIDGHGQEDFYYGYYADDEHSPQEQIYYLEAFLDRSKNEGKVILVTDYCSTYWKMMDSYSENQLKGYISFAADHRALDNIPGFPLFIHNENDSVITSLSQVKNFLYLINTVNYQSKEEFINAVTATNYDLLIMDLFFENNVICTADDIARLRQKANGGSRMILCYLSIGEAEDYRYYWKDGWKPGNPSWMGIENPDWEGNYQVFYWEPKWQDIIYGNDDSYVKMILDAGFDGAYLDMIDAFEYFE
jgi:cysteinyl-tRNA synthetase